MHSIYICTVAHLIKSDKRQPSPLKEALTCYICWELPFKFTTLQKNNGFTDIARVVYLSFGNKNN